MKCKNNTGCPTDTSGTETPAVERLVGDAEVSDTSTKAGITFYYKIKLGGNALPTNAKCYVQRTDVAGASKVLVTDSTDYEINIPYTPYFPKNIVLTFTVERTSSGVTTVITYPFNDYIGANNSDYFQTISGKKYRIKAGTTNRLEDFIIYPKPTTTDGIDQIVTWPPSLK